MNERKMNILNSLSKLEILTRSQIRALHDTKSVRNTNFILSSLADYLSHVRLHENAYYLNRKGQELTGTQKPFKLSNQLEHKIMRNEAYVYFRPTTWVTEKEFKIGSLSVIPDAFFYSGSSYKFLEVDNTQRWNVNVEKMETYKKIKATNAFQVQYGKFPVLVWVVKFKSRKEKLLELAKKHNLHIDVYLYDEIKC